VLLLEIQIIESFAFWELYKQIKYQIMKPVTKINTFKIIPSLLLPKSSISLSKEAVNTM